MNTAPGSARPAPRFEFIDLFRGAAIIIVLLYHSSVSISGQSLRWRDGFWDPTGFDPVRSVFQMLLQWACVPTLLFVASGFVVHLTRLQRPDMPIGQFVARRVQRLYVPYLIVLLFFALVFPGTRMRPTSLEAITQLVTHVVPVFNLNEATLWTYNPSFWYVATELQLCLLYPLVLAGVRRWGWTRVLMLLGLAELCGQIGSTLIDAFRHDGLPQMVGDNWAARCALSYCLSWSLGAWVADRWRAGDLTAPSRTWLFAAPALALALTLGQVTSVLAMSAVALTGVNVMRYLLVGKGKADPAAQGLDARRRPVRAMLLWISRYSLAIYLLNQPIMRLLHDPVGRLVTSSTSQLFVLALLGAVITMPLAWAFTRWCEIPVGRWVSRQLEPWIQGKRTPIELLSRGPRRAPARIDAGPPAR